MTTPEPTPGWKTTEFWLTLAPYLVFGVSSAVTALVESGTLGEGSVEMRIALFSLTILSLIGSALATAGYSVARGMTKSAALNLKATETESESIERVARIEQATADADRERRPPIDPTLSNN